MLLAYVKLMTYNYNNNNYYYYDIIQYNTLYTNRRYFVTQTSIIIGIERFTFTNETAEQDSEMSFVRGTLCLLEELKNIQRIIYISTK